MRLFLRGSTWWVQSRNCRLSTGQTDEFCAKLWALRHERCEMILAALREDRELTAMVRSALQQQDKARRSGHIYGISDGALVKIGFTSKDPLQRLAQLQTGRAEKLQLIALTAGTRETERQLHEAFVDARIRGEWFDGGHDLVAGWVASHWYKTGTQLSGLEKSA